METELRKILLEIYKANKDYNDEAVEKILLLFDVVGQSEQLYTFLQWFIDNESKIEGNPEIKDFVKIYLESR